MAKNTEKRLARAVRDITPDVLPKILRRLDEEHDDSNNVTELAPTSKKSYWKRLIAGAAAVFVLLAGSYFAYGNLMVDSVVGFDVNPSIQLTVNRNEKIISVTPLNEDAVIMLDGMNLKNVDLDVAVNALIGSMLKNGYLSDIANSVLISVENGDPDKAAQLQQRLSDSVSGLLSAYALDGSVISQSYTGKDTDTDALAREFEISYSKAQLVQKLVELDGTLLFADIAALPVNDIKLLIEAAQAVPEGVTSDGNASSAAYIGGDKALEIALGQAGLAASDITLHSSKLDYDDGRMIYEIEFYGAAGEYEFDIDALTGTVISFDCEGYGHGAGYGSDHGQQGNGPNGATQSPDAYIGVAAAKNIALSHAGLDQSQVSFIKEKLDEDDGCIFYKIEFLWGGREYEYEIDAVTGDVLKYDREGHHDDDYHSD